MSYQRIAVIGSGISGLGSAYLLNQNYDVTLFESNSKLGGHTNTIKTSSGLPIDTGFIEFKLVSGNINSVAWYHGFYLDQPHPKSLIKIEVCEIYLLFIYFYLFLSIFISNLFFNDFVTWNSFP